MSEIKKIYIAHQYEDASHFKALYDELNEYNYTIKEYFILSKIFLFRRLLGGIFKRKEIKKSITIFIKDMLNNIKFSKIKGQIIIVGLAPYDNLMNKYKDVFKANKCIYFTSWQTWDGSRVARGNIKNKEEFETILINNFYAAACVSKLTQNEIKKFFKYSEVVNHAIDVEEYSKKMNIMRNDKVRFIYLGQLIERKNINLMIEWINSNDNDFEFYFVGNGPLRKKIITITKNDNRIHYLGKLSKSKIKILLKDFDFLVLPSKEEPFGIVLLEALSSGVPCVVSNVSGPIEIIEESKTGFIFDKENKTEFFSVMNNCFNIDDDLYYFMSSNCIESSKKYSTKNVIKKWIDLIKYVEKA